MRKKHLFGRPQAISSWSWPRRLFVGLAFLLTLLLLLSGLEQMEENTVRASQPDRLITPVTVDVAVASPGLISEWILGEGVVEAVRKRHLQFEVAGKVTFLAHDNGQPLREGSIVRGPRDGNPGQLLARIDPRDSRADIKRSKAELAEAHRGVEMERALFGRAQNELAHARTDLGRKRTLYEKGLLAKSEFDNAKTRFDNAMQTVSSVKARMAAAKSKSEAAMALLEKSSRGEDRTTLFAPFDGLVARINVKEGDYFEPEDVHHRGKANLLATAPITVIDPFEMEVSLDLPAFRGSRVRVGQMVEVSPGAKDWFTDARNDALRLEGRVYSVSPQLDWDKRSIRVKVRFHQTENILRDGMYSTCWIRVAHNANTLRVPISSLLFRDNKPYVYVFNDGIAKRRDIRLGLEDNDYVEVVDGLSPGDLVIMGGRNRITHGQPVRYAGRNHAS